MFKSARLKLTIFYAAAIIVMSLVLTIGTRGIADRIFEHSNAAQQPGIRALLKREVGLPLLTGPEFDKFETQNEKNAERQLNLYVIYINLAMFVIGVSASYWFAGKTLKPIQEAHEAQTRFASDASHEIRTPLTAMRTENEVFLRQNSFTEEQAREVIKSNLEEIHRLDQLSSNLLAMSKIEDGRPLKLSNVDANEIKDKALSYIAKIYPEDVARIDVNVKEVSIKGNADSLAQVLFIFLENAIKYGPKDKPIFLKSKDKNEVYQFMIDDSGPGIDTKDLPHIFDRLYRADKSRSTIPGHGLGLSLALSIAKANKAGLSAANLKKGGARFILSLEKA